MPHFTENNIACFFVVVRNPDINLFWKVRLEMIFKLGIPGQTLRIFAKITCHTFSCHDSWHFSCRVRSGQA